MCLGVKCRRGVLGFGEGYPVHTEAFGVGLLPCGVCE